VDGRFTIPRVPAGTVTLQARLIGYTPKTVTGIMLAADRTVAQDISLDQSAAILAATVVTATDERGSVSEALNTQKTAIGIVSAVTVEADLQEPRQRRGPGRAARERRDRAEGRQPVCSRTRRALYHHATQRNTRTQP
jgi:hypothetical protein